MTDDLVLEPECKKITRLSSTARWRLEKQNKFPRRFKIGDPDAQNGRIAWSRTELENWRSERMAARK
jgi:predicted DNA-binding transcriptional regulator AlpA